MCKNSLIDSALQKVDQVVKDLLLSNFNGNEYDATSFYLMKDLHSGQKLLKIVSSSVKIIQFQQNQGKNGSKKCLIHGIFLKNETIQKRFSNTMESILNCSCNFSQMHSQAISLFAEKIREFFCVKCFHDFCITNWRVINHTGFVKLTNKAPLT